MIGHDILFSLWFFAPAGIANSTPIGAAHLPLLRNLNAPLDFGKKLRKRRIFGEHKTCRGVICGTIMAILVVWLQMVCFHHYAWVRHTSAPVSYVHLSVLWLGLLLGFGALAGDAIESFLKRQWNIPSGQRWFPFDQLDYVIGGLLAATIYVRLPLQDYGWIIVIWFTMHVLFSYIGYLLKLKDRPL
jgi:CDP-2,3-bis-(O-geranylgeranyl)-sn-glycerol synthase